MVQNGHLMSLGSLFFEPLWIFHRPDLAIERTSNLKGMRLAVGEEGSGTRILTTHFLELNGINKITLTKVDVLDQLDTIRVCTGYRHNGKTVVGMPASLAVLEQCEPVYTEYPGWKQNTSGIRTFDKLPENAKRYVDGLQNHLEVEIPLVSTGPGREETIMRGDLL